MSDIATVYATFPDAAEAERISRTLVEEQLAACANILGLIRSIYRWQGAIEEGEEVAALFKTRADLAPRLIERLSELHSYEVPAATMWPVAHAPGSYRDWVLGETSSAPQPER